MLTSKNDLKLSLIKKANLLNNKSIAIIILVIIHLVGIAGLLSPWKETFVLLTPLNLLLSFFILLQFNETKNLKFYLITLMIMVLGFGIEVLGVNTGFPFGEYRYGEAFGPKMLGTPFLIGVNWFIMAYCGALIFKDRTPNKIINAALAGITVTAIDIILEPVAIAFNFWQWSAPEVPLQNYLTWTICIGIFAYVIYNFQENIRNPIAKWILGIQVIFFTVLLCSTYL